jgi:NAD(P)-dependent dehydrogenase (short-subunit alcohol dehydrogenase family)
MNATSKTKRVPNEPVGRRAVVITGASSGIGRACALKLARAGFHVFAGIRNDEDAKALECAAPEGSLRPLFLDVTDSGRTASDVEIVAEAVGGGDSPGS